MARAQFIDWGNIRRMLDEVPEGMFGSDDDKPTSDKGSFPWKDDPLWRPPADDQAEK